MSTTPATTSYTDAQLQNAIDAAFPLAGASYLANLDTSPEASHWPVEAPNRLAIGKAFLAALSKPAEASAEPEQAWANADNAKAFKEFQAEIEAVWEAKDSPWTPKPGDVVRLKSGGLPMTVESVTGFGIAFCSWMTTAGSLETRPVAVVMLTTAKEGQP